jgi:acetylornithine deacetylase/succinyl-diaminopimelate desuccinylase-like protein
MLAPLLALAVAAAVPADADFERIAQANLPEYLELLAIPNVASEPADIRRNAAFLQAALERRGFVVQALDNPAQRPLVFAELRSARPDAKTLLLYIHFDGQPVVPEEWAQPDPFVPVVKRRVGDTWEIVPTERLLQSPLDPELRVFARAASDDKGPIAMLFNAIDLLRERGETPAQHIKLLLDSEEEISSPSLAGVAGRHRALLAADALVILDGPEHASGRPTVVFGNRGMAQATLTVYGPKAPLHSGHYGNYAPNPAIRLAQLLAGMKDDDGRVLVEGYYDGVELDDAERAQLARTPDDEPALRKRIGIAAPDRVGSTYQEALQYPSLNVRGLAAASVGAKAANIVPSEAVAELDFRTTPETDGARLQDLVQAHVEQRGYHVTAGPPTDDERARHPRLASFVRGPVQRAMRTPDDTPLSRWAIAALSAPQVAAGVEPVRIRMMGGTLPTDVLIDALALPFVMVCTVNADNNQHARDENLRMGNLVRGTRTVHALLTTPMDLPRSP